MLILRKYLKRLTPDERADFARRCGTTAGYLRKATYGKQVSPALAVALERESGGAIPRQKVRQDWREVWPDLAAASLPRPSDQ